ncbi:RNA-binding protein 41-like isoform X1 [Biomphalaria glabrata]|uniref:RNA-binding protein 41-like isoform X1 n=2 Tax=Biomphalaria glabrata TaxID=6526 RepID=A0A9U8EK03_BIOGL|nr:RNA-binding protein 41-like isoform X1 [Biomphalaria glabrata]
MTTMKTYKRDPDRIYISTQRMNHKVSKKVEGSMPCGNPKRFESRDVLRMPQAVLQNKKRKIDGQEHIETQSEKHLQILLQRQVKKDVTLSDQFSHHRSFTPATSHDPGVEKLVGVHSFQHYKTVGDLDSKIDHLRHCGLNDEEVTIWLQEEMKIESTPGYGAHPLSKSAQLIEIQKKITEKEKSLSVPDTFQGALELSRQERDLEISIAQKFGTISDLPSIITQKKFKDTHPDDPINHLSEILSDIDKKTERDSRRDRRRRRKLERKKLYYESLKLNTELDADPTDHLAERTRQDLQVDSSDISCDIIKDCPDPAPHNNETSKTLDIICERLSDSNQIIEKERGNTNSNQESSSRTEISGPINFIPRREIENNKLTLEEIKSMEKFRNFTFGEPNKIVYVKNLHPKVSDEDLVALFACFQTADKPQIIFKRLTGRMKGQAFITFPDEATAGEAIQLVNGYKLRDKPIILSYGKKTAT